MAEAIISGITESHDQLQVLVSDIDIKRTQLLEESYGTITVESIKSICEQADIIILAVKPQIVKYVLANNQEFFTNSHLVISIAAGISLSNLKTMIPKAKIVRVMPNIPALIGYGASVLTSLEINQEEHLLVEEIFKSVGHVYWMDEKYFDAVTSLSGSGPAYVYLFIEAMIDAGVNEGLPRDIARKLALDTVIGSAMMVDFTGKHPGELKDMVTSPGGTTIRAVEVLEERGFRNAILKAIAAAAKRSRELGE